MKNCSERTFILLSPSWRQYKPRLNNSTLKMHAASFPLVLQTPIWKTKSSSFTILTGVFILQSELQRERSSMWCFSAQVQARIRELHPSCPHGWQRPEYLDHLLQLFPGHSQGTVWPVQPLGHKPAPIRDAAVRGTYTLGNHMGPSEVILRFLLTVH